MSFENRYSFSDRLLHRIAFSTSQLQVVLSDIEDTLYEKKFQDVKVDKPVFITAIPRAGTTLLLEMLVKGNEFVSHSYRDMPFVLMPLFWDMLSRAFRKEEQVRERAHGDGIKINVDSPEAFEEVIWKTFWKKQYREKYISTWSLENKSDGEFEQYFRNHLKKITLLHSSKKTESIRYLSKNNLNIARIPFLQKMFPDARVVVPFRDPVQHAASLLKQHLNFMKIHQEDSFAREYMAAIGHFDFGENLKPVDFDNWFSTGDPATPDTLTFWLQYWFAAHKYLQQKCNERVKLFNYDWFCNNPEEGLQLLVDFLELGQKNNLLQQAERVRAPKPHEIDTKSVPSELIKNVNELFLQLSSDPNTLEHL